MGSTIAGGSVSDYINSNEMCIVCRQDKTTIHAEVAPGQQVYVCEKCLETAKQNFIWICMSCGNVYIRPKSLVLKRLADPSLKHAYLQYKDQQIIQGIDRCIECDTTRIVQYVAEISTPKAPDTADAPGM